MDRTLIRHLRQLLLLLLVGLAVPAGVHAQEPVADPAQLTPAALTQQINDLRKLATDAAADQLDEQTRKQVLEVCDKAASQLAKAKEANEEMARLKAEVEGASAPPTNQPQAGQPAPQRKRLEGLDLAELQVEQSNAAQAVTSAKEKLDLAAAEIKQSAARRLELPDAMVQARQKITKAEEALQGDYSADHPLLAQAKRLNQQAAILLARAEIQLMELKGNTFEIISRSRNARQERLAKELKAAEEWEAEVAARLARQQQIDADKKASEAKRAVVFAHPAVKAEAQRNVELAEQYSELVQKKSRLEEQVKRTANEADEAKDKLENAISLDEQLRGSPTIGTILRGAQDQLPNLTQIRERQRKRAARVTDLRMQVYDWKAELAKTTDKKLSEAVATYEADTEEQVSPEIEDELREVIEDRDETLKELVAHTNSYLTELGKLNTSEAIIVDQTQALSDFLTERVFWVPSAPRLSARDLAFTRDFWTNYDARLADLRLLGEYVLEDAKLHVELWLLPVMVTLLLLLWRRRAKKIMYDAGEQASKPAATSFRPTVMALLATIVLASPTPLLIGFLGWRLGVSTNVLPYATGVALSLFARQYLILNLLRHSCRSGGLGPDHFGWERKGLVSLRRAARVMQVVALPLMAIAVGVEVTRDGAAINSIGRLSLILALLVMGGIGFLFFRPHGPLINSLAARGDKPWVTRLVRLLGPLSVASALGLAVASGLGMHFTAIQLTRRILFSAGVVFICLAVRAFLMRWLLVAYRRVAMQRAREKRKAMLEAQENAPTEAAAIEVEPEISLSDINQQARSLVGVGVTACIIGAMVLAWGDVLPALNALNDPDTFGLWQSGVPNEEGVYPKVTVAGLLLSLGVFTLTWFAGRNVPGLLEIALFQKLPLDAGARYAATSVSRYLIVVVGGVIGVGMLGISWSSVQWLVAAMTVGLGFGLQEIFANFVSGIILLFERPVRPGDVVTIGNVSGVVTRIRIRATTVQDWDNKELIVPNRDFITGNLINWTLSSRVLRHVLKVGVAYGSDTRLATELLYKVARENEHVADTPEPFVLFDTFGDSSLNFELRVFTQDLSHMMPMRHSLMLAVDDEFRKHGIEIAFPQRDLHIRSMPEALEKLTAPGDDSAEHRVLEEAGSKPGFGFSRDN
ncbi:Mechanosensitive channel MscK precursor [Posidoniimonas corsicana]|uniref:Mechanosensitive channel MscK n=1 Tax=Posidoniimonas corsicana TaxID=1938618 RepID=A0A5C5UZ91_9BACT|nr:mechanosensitive ion channel domain-containing protein [Posidoniimonas corsicana]TWT30983.1 Mechanosensitive channel MscK precursor [Posidoniimonas corsicana]